MQADPLTPTRRFLFSRSSSAVWLAACVLLVVPVWTIVVAAQLRTDVPWGDHLMIFMDTHLNHRLSLEGILQFHNENVIVFTKLPIYLDYVLLQGANLLPWLIPVFITLMIPLLAAWTLRETPGLTRSSLAMTAALLLAVYCNGRQFLSLIFPAMQHASINFFLVIALLAAGNLLAGGRSRNSLILFVAAYGCASLSSANGVLIGPAVLCVALAFVRKPRAAVLVAVAACMVLFVGAYAGAFAWETGTIQPRGLRVADALRFLLLFVGAPFFRDSGWPVEHHSNAFLMYATAGLFWLVLIGLVVQLYRNRDKVSAPELFHLMVIVFIVVTAATGAMFRSQTGAVEAVNKKYAPTALLAWMSAAALLIRLRPGLLQGNGRWGVLRAPVIAAVLLVLLLPGDLLEASVWRTWNDQISEAACATASGVYSSALLRRLWYTPADGYAVLQELSAANTYCFRRMPPPGYPLRQHFAITGLADRTELLADITPARERADRQGALIGGLFHQSVEPAMLVIADSSDRVVGYGQIASEPSSNTRHWFAATQTLDANELKLYVAHGKQVRQIGCIKMPDRILKRY